MLSKETLNSVCEQVTLGLINHYLVAKDIESLKMLTHLNAKLTEENSTIRLNVTVVHTEEGEPLFVLNHTEALYNLDGWIVTDVAVGLNGMVYYSNNSLELKPFPPEYWVSGTLAILRALYLHKELQCLLDSPFLTAVKATGNGYTVFNDEIMLAEQQLYVEFTREGKEGTPINEDFLRDSGVEKPTLYSGEEEEDFQSFMNTIPASNDGTSEEH